MSAMRGLPKGMTVYAATKAGLAALAEGIRAELLATPIRVTTLFPGFIESEMTAGAGRPIPFLVDAARGARMLADAIEREPATARLPAWPWVPAGFLMRHLPLGWVGRWL
jgi:NAD(P)-dependent dehydrogenase (short-subunit alcohol dehydrogenase family)